GRARARVRGSCLVDQVRTPPALDESRRLAASQHRRFCRDALSARSRREAMGVGGNQSVRYLASRIAGRHLRARLLPGDVCRHSKMAARGMGRLSLAAALLADRRTRESLPRTRRLVAYAKSDGPTLVAGTVHGWRRRTAALGVRRDPKTDHDVARRS